MPSFQKRNCNFEMAFGVLSLQYWRNLSFCVPKFFKIRKETYLKRNLNKEIDWEVLDANETYLLQALEVKSLINLSEIEAFIPKKKSSKPSIH